jgi:hypothetical protein
VGGFVRLRTCLIASLLCLGACGESLKSGNHWREVGSIENGFIPFVVVDAASAHDGAVYKNAADTLSADPHTMQIGFFLPSDTIPPNGSRGDFFGAGGWKPYSPATVYSGGQFSSWDCSKAGVEDAPLSALCGKGVKEQYDAILSLASRDAWVIGCGLPKSDGRTVVQRFAETLTPAKRDQVLHDFDNMYSESTSGPDNPSDCQTLRPHIEKEAQAARNLLVSATANAVHQN